MTRRDRQDQRRAHGTAARGATLGQARTVANLKRKETTRARVAAWLEQRQIDAHDRRDARAKERQSHSLPDEHDQRETLLVDSQGQMGSFAGIAAPRAWRRMKGQRTTSQPPGLAGGPWPARHRKTEHWVRRERRERQLALVRQGYRP